MSSEDDPGLQSLDLGYVGSLLRGGLEAIYAQEGEELEDYQVANISRQTEEGAQASAQNLTVSSVNSSAYEQTFDDSHQEEPVYTTLAAVEDFGGGEYPDEANDVIQDYFSVRTEYNYEIQRELGHEEPEIQCEMDEGEYEEDASDQDESDAVQREFSGAAAQKIYDKDELFDEEFFKASCCSWNCNEYFRKEIIKDTRDSAKENDYWCPEHTNHLHLILLGQLSALTMTEEPAVHHGRNSDRQRQKTKYMFRGLEVCKKFFLYINNCGEKRLRIQRQQLQSHGIEPKIHGITGRAPANATPTEKVRKCKTFLRNFCDVHALVLPGRLPYHDVKYSKLRILPSSFSKTEVYGKYKNATEDPVSEYVFLRIWRKFMPYVIVQNPRTDLCSVCYKNTMSLSRLTGLRDEEKMSIIEKSRSHLQRVMDERNLYREETTRLAEPLDLRRSVPLSYTGSMHYSFDFAQQVFLPSDSQQVGALYFLTPYKVALFGVACEPLGKFVLYLIPESALGAGKGSNTVISLLHHFLENFGLGEEHIFCHADNCAGQNKNNYLLQYAAWRVKTIAEDCTNDSGSHFFLLDTPNSLQICTLE